MKKTINLFMSFLSFCLVAAISTGFAYKAHEAAQGSGLEFFLATFAGIGILASVVVPIIVMSVLDK